MIFEGFSMSFAVNSKYLQILTLVRGHRSLRWWWWLQARLRWVGLSWMILFQWLFLISNIFSCLVSTTDGSRGTWTLVIGVFCNMWSQYYSIFSGSPDINTRTPAYRRDRTSGRCESQPARLASLILLLYCHHSSLSHFTNQSFSSLSNFQMSFSRPTCIIRRRKRTRRRRMLLTPPFEHVGSGDLCVILCNSYFF